AGAGPQADAPRRGPGMEGRGGRMAQFSEQDRTAFMAARIAAMKAGLLLTPDQERLWPAVENAFRDMAKTRQDWRERMQKEGRPPSPVDGMRRMGEMASARGEAMKRLADAADPLYKTLSDDQKRRLRMLGSHMGGMGGMAMGGMEMGSGMREGMGHGGGMRGHHRHHDNDRQGWRDRGDDDRGSRHGGMGRGMRQDMRQDMRDDMRQLPPPLDRSADWAPEGFDRGGGVGDWRNL
ncbi:MAG: hypothetical protein JWM36_2015, partial [Hyphomicrobiales bacterium]|nr:hypothetical protein [Hyphomicrobiales bacterium]